MKSWHIAYIVSGFFTAAAYACGGGTSGSGDADSGVIDAGATDTGGNPRADAAALDAGGHDGGTAPVVDPAVQSAAIDQARESPEPGWVHVDGLERDIFGQKALGSDGAIVQADPLALTAGKLSKLDFSSVAFHDWRLTGGGIAAIGPTTFRVALGATNLTTTGGTVTTGMAQRVRFRGSYVSSQRVPVSADAPRVGLEGPVCAGGSSFNPLSKNPCVNPGAAAFSYEGSGSSIEPAGPGAATIDSIRAAPLLDGVIIAGRLDGVGPFKFGGFTGVDAGVDAQNVTGPAIYVAQYSTTSSWLRVFPVSGVLPSSSLVGGVLPSEADEPGYGPTTLGRVLVAPYTGTLHVPGGVDLVAPANSYATAMIPLTADGAVMFARSFPKGPASLGKVSHATANCFSSSNICSYVDTVWDTIDFGGGMRAEATHGADVAVTWLDATNGSTKRVRVYGGPGDDEPLCGADIVSGRSNGPIDFGNGVLSPSPGATQIWFAEF